MAIYKMAERAEAPACKPMPQFPSWDPHSGRRSLTPENSTLMSQGHTCAIGTNMRVCMYT